VSLSAPRKELNKMGITTEKGPSVSEDHRVKRKKKVSKESKRKSASKEGEIIAPCTRGGPLRKMVIKLRLTSTQEGKRT